MTPSGTQRGPEHLIHLRSIPVEESVWLSWVGGGVKRITMETIRPLLALLDFEVDINGPFPTSLAPAPPPGWKTGRPGE